MLWMLSGTHKHAGCVQWTNNNSTYIPQSRTTYRLQRVSFLIKNWQNGESPLFCCSLNTTTVIHSASSAKPHHIWSTSATQYPTSPAGSTYNPPTPTYSSTALSSLDVRPSGLLCCRPYSLEHTSRRPSRPGIDTTYFQSRTENSAVLILLAHQRIRGSTVRMRYINLRLTLTLTNYLTTP